MVEHQTQTKYLKDALISKALLWICSAAVSDISEPLKGSKARIKPLAGPVIIPGYRF